MGKEEKTEGKMAPPEQVAAVFSVSNPEKRIPKHCNGVYFSKLTDDSIIMVFVAKEGIKLSVDQPFVEENIIIEKIVVDKEHAKKIAEKLNELTS